jgi:CBS domain containing-hemolysin-like protein
MLSVQVRSQVSLEELLKGVAQLEARELEHFVARVLAIRAQRLAPSLIKEEAELLERIGHGLSPADQERYRELMAKRQAETLSPEEHAELLEWTGRIEQADAERVRALSSLAQLRGVSVEEVMTDLGIRTPAYE